MQFLTIFVFVTFVLLALVELVVPARRLPAIPGWRFKGALFFLLTLFLSTRAPLFWDRWLAEYRLIDATSLGDVGGAIVGFLVLELGVYVWHRAMHGFDFLWRWFHQMHHSAERVDVFGAFYFHPFDALGFSLVGSLCLVLVLGVTGPAALAASCAASFCSLFQHANVRTPRWLGWLVQRPESHAHHHRRGVHAFNYGDIPIWDILFGTFRNPARFEGVGGFHDGASKRLVPMLLGRDVSRPPRAQAGVLRDSCAA